MAKGRYREDSVEQRLLDDDLYALAIVVRWIAVVLSTPTFWSVRQDWPDIQQEVLEKVIDSLSVGRFDGSRDFQAYVQSATRNTALTALQEWRRRAATLEGVAPAPTSESVEERIISRQLVRRVLDLATAECRDLIRAYFFEERSYAEISETAGVPVGTVKSRLFRCLEGVRRAVFGRAAPDREQTRR